MFFFVKKTVHTLEASEGLLLVCFKPLLNLNAELKNSSLAITRMSCFHLCLRVPENLRLIFQEETYDNFMMFSSLAYQMMGG